MLEDHNFGNSNVQVMAVVEAAAAAANNGMVGDDDDDDDEAGDGKDGDTNDDHRADATSI